MAIFNSQLLVYQRVVLRCLRALEDLFRRWCPWRNWDFEMSVLSGFGFRVENSPRNPSFLRLKSHSIVVNYIIWLVVWTPLKKYDFVSWGYYSQYMESQNPNVPNHQPVVYIYISLYLGCWNPSCALSFLDFWSLNSQLEISRLKQGHCGRNPCGDHEVEKVSLSGTFTWHFHIFVGTMQWGVFCWAFPHFFGSKWGVKNIMMGFVQFGDFEGFQHWNLRIHGQSASKKMSNSSLT